MPDLEGEAGEEDVPITSISWGGRDSHSASQHLAVTRSGPGGGDASINVSPSMSTVQHPLLSTGDVKTKEGARPSAIRKGERLSTFGAVRGRGLMLWELKGWNSCRVGKLGRCPSGVGT